ncbi:MAG: hypothetical protein IPP56_00645 [Bacteroidetes bacterium]|nr:hypothetical protein [Bacteroidota bacterium]MBK9798285.1 hypothetical protein [Bacteroidota bacterium]MBP6413786.1 hypothetical protein [Bacteroidia bacterium]
MKTKLRIQFIALIFATTSGIAQVPVMLKDINPGSGNSNVTDFEYVNGTVFFRASDGLL